MTDFLLSPADLATLSTAGDIVILDVRSGPDGAGRAAFEAGHIPGARHTDYAADGWRRRVGNVPGLLPGPAHLQALFGCLGLSPQQRIIVVPEGMTANDLAAAARIVWTLSVAGYTPIGLLDGGTRRWKGEGRPLETGASTHVATTAAPVIIDATERADADDVLGALATHAPLIDGRAPSYFRGEEKASEALAFGHIPGAQNIDYTTAFDAATGRLKSRDDLAALYVVPPGEVISYCNTGHTAALNWLVLARILGRPARLYDGSMTDWTQNAAHPVAQGPR